MLGGISRSPEGKSGTAADRYYRKKPPTHPSRTIAAPGTVQQLHYLHRQCLHPLTTGESDAQIAPDSIALSPMVVSPPPLCPRRSRHKLVASSATESTQAITPTETFRIALGAGAVAGFTVDAVLFPLDTLKTRLQLSSSVAPKSPAALLTGLYAGFGPAVVASAPAAAAFFGVYDYVKHVLEDFVGTNKQYYAPLCHMVAAAAGDVAGSTVRAPFEVVKQRVQSGLYAGAGAAIRGTLAKEGLAGFYTGYGSLVIRELPFDAIQFPLYEYLKGVAKKRKRGQTLETWETSMCGSVAGAISAALTTPLDVVKTRLMTQNVAAPKYNGIVHGISKIASEEGPRALMAGVVPRVMWISIGGAVFFGAYEAAKKALAPMIVKSSKGSRDNSKLS